MQTREAVWRPYEDDPLFVPQILLGLNALEPDDAARLCRYLAALDQQPGDRLAVFVQQPVGGGRVADGDDGEQGARGDEVADPRRDRAVGQFAHQVRAGRLPADQRLADDGGVGWVGWGGRVGGVAHAGGAMPEAD